MKVIELLNKIANGEELPKKIKYRTFKLSRTESYNIKWLYVDEYGMYFPEHYYADLNDEVEILEEPKGIPEKLSYYSMEKIQKAKNKDEWQEERISLLEKRVEDLHIKMNELLDYLESKGE